MRILGVALAAAAYFSLSEPAERGIKRFSLADVDTGSIDRLVIEGDKPIELKRPGETWQLANGKDADPAAVKRLLDSFDKLKSSNQLTSDQQRYSDYEVGEDKGLRVQAFAGDREVAELTVGKSASGGVYVLYEGDVFKVDQVYRNVFAKKRAQWMQRKLFADHSPEDVRRVDVSLADGSSYSVLREEGEWRLKDESVLPEDFRFSSSKVERMVSSVVRARARDILEEAPSKETTGFESGDALTLHLAPEKAEDSGAKEGNNDEAKVAKGGKEDADGQTPSTALKLTVGNKTEDGKVYARVSGREDVYVLPAYTARQLRKAPTDFRDLSLMRFSVSDVKTLRIRDGKRTLVFKKKDDEWTLARHTEDKPEGFELDPNAVQRRLRRLHGAKAKRLAESQSLARTGIRGSRSQLRAELSDGQAAVLTFGKTTNNDGSEVVYTRGNVDERVYVVSKRTQTGLLKGLESFKKRARGAGAAGMPPGLANMDADALKNLPPEVRRGLQKKLEKQKRQQKLLKRLQQKRAAD